MKLTINRAIIGVALIGLIVCTVMITMQFIPDRRQFFTDADTIKQPRAEAPLRDILWQPPVKLPELINAETNVYEPRVSWDGLTLFFVRGKPGENSDIYYCTRTPDGWTDPQPLEHVNSEEDDLGPEPSADGRSLYFYSNREGTLGGHDIWVSHRGRDGWQTPINLGPAVNSEFNDYGPALTSDGKTLYYASNRPLPDDAMKPDPDAWPATLREDLYHRTYDIYVTTITDAGPAPAEPLMALNTPYNEGSPCVSPVDDFLYFASDRPGGEGGFDIYRTRRLRGEYLPPTALGPPVNTAANELDPGLTMGGYRLYFSSDQPRARLDPEKPNDYNVYVSSSREVFLDTESIAKPPFNWAALAALWPNLLWLLLALLALLALLFWIRASRDRKLSLLARCVLASLMLHALLMLLFAGWDVSQAVSEMLRDKGEIRIALASPTTGDDIAMQIRGQLTAIEAPRPVEIEAERQELQTEVQPAEATMASVTVEREAVELNEQPVIEIAAVDAPARGPEMMPIDEPISQPEQTQLDIATPSESARIDADEADEIAYEAPAPPSPAERPRALIPTSQPVGVAIEVALNPEATDASESHKLDRSMADATAAADAAPDRTSPSDQAPALASIQASSIDLLIPTETGQHEQQSESSDPMLAASDTTTRRELLLRSSTAAASQVQIEPIGTNGHPSDADATLVSQSAETIHDAVPAGQTMPGAEPRTPSSVVTRVKRLALPMLESAAAADARESPIQFASHVTIVPRAAFDADSDRRRDRRPISIATLAPSRTDGATDQSPSLVSAIGSPSDARRAVTLLTARDPDLDRRRPGTSKLGLRLPTEITPPKSDYTQRNQQQRKAVINRMGGSDETEKAVAAALNWLARHQSPDGRWAAHKFDAGCGHCGGQPTAFADIDVATTGLALLCFLGADHTHVKDGPYGDTVRRGVEWLLSVQRPAGDLRYGYDMNEDGDLEELEETMYGHGIAAIALSEAYGMTGDPKLLSPVRNAAYFIVDARNQRQGGWRYDPGQKGDTSVLGWQVMALKSAQMAGIDVPREGFASARDWMDLISSQNRPGQYAYRPRHRATHSMTAEGMFVLQLLGVSRGEASQLHSAAFISRRMLEWEDANTYYWYYATLALFQHQGEPWQRWNASLKPLLLDNQQTDGPRAGSWEPVGEWSDIGGRVYQTALCTLMLEVYYRYLPLYAAPPSLAEGAIGAVRGRVTDIESGRPIEGATIRLTLPKRPPMTVTTGPDGRYTLDIPAVPKFFALSASRPGFVPATANIPSSEVLGNALTQNFLLWPQGRDIIALEDDPEVHHLGNDAFTGSINSQFQRESEGDRFIAPFELDADRVPPQNTSIRLWLLHKGSQCPHEVYLNGERIGDLVRSPDDGSFGEHTIRFNSNVLRPGTNVLEIQAISCSGDLDDWEFVNLQIRLSR